VKEKTVEKDGGGFNAETGFDSTYALRHDHRNRRKVQRILLNVDAGQRFLDIGCNQGYISAALLNNDKAQHVDAIELNRSVVRKDLVQNPHFDLFEGSVTDFKFQYVYTGIIYCAVHHHVFALFGKLQAFATWRQIIDHCDRQLIFETGQISEGSKWYWQEKLRHYYPDDQEYIGALLHAIGPRLKNIKVVDKLPIHGINRMLLKIELHPLKSIYSISRTGSGTYGDLPGDEAGWVHEKSFRRTIGSKFQRLIEVDHEKNDSQEQNDTKRTLYEGTTFYILRNRKTDEKCFGKHIEDDPFKVLRELELLKQIDHPRVLQPIAATNSFGLIFPYIPYCPLHSLVGQEIENPDELIAEILAFFQYAREKKVELGLLDFDMTGQHQSHKLIDVVDFHAANFLVGLHNNSRSVHGWAVVDMEYYSNYNRIRNEKHLRKILLTLGLSERDIRTKNPLVKLSRKMPKSFKLKKLIDKYLYSAIVDEEPGAAKPIAKFLESPFEHLLNNIRYSRRQSAQVEVRMFDRKTAPPNNLLTKMSKKFRKIKRRLSNTM